MEQELSTAIPAQEREERVVRVVKKEDTESYRHGVLSAGLLLQVIENRWRQRSVPPETSASLDALCQLTVDEKLTHLWILDDVEADAAYYEAASAVWDLRVNWKYASDRVLPPGRVNLLSSASGFRRAPKGGSSTSV